jgi:hypothetical protein
MKLPIKDRDLETAAKETFLTMYGLLDWSKREDCFP